MHTPHLLSTFDVSLAASATLRLLHGIAKLADATIHVSPAAAPGLNPHAGVAHHELPPQG